MEVKVFSSHDWKLLSVNAHLIAFDQLRPPELDRIDFALLAVDEDTPLGYMTCREQDAETIYMQFGGKFPSADSMKAFKGYKAGLEHLEKYYKRASTLIENTNTSMLKFAMKAGLRITGVRYFKNRILVEHTIEWDS